MHVPPFVIVKASLENESKPTKMDTILGSTGSECDHQMTVGQGKAERCAKAAGVPYRFPPEESRGRLFEQLVASASAIRATPGQSLVRESFRMLLSCQRGSNKTLKFLPLQNYGQCDSSALR